MNDITALAQQLRATAEKANEHGEFNMAMHTVQVLALVEALEKALRSNEYLREQSAEWERKAISNFEECAEMSARIEELESQRKLAFTAGNRWADKFREAEKRIASLESRTVTVKLPPRVDSSNVPFTAHTWNCCLDEVEKRLTAAGIQVIEGEA